MERREGSRDAPDVLIRMWAFGVLGFLGFWILGPQPSQRAHRGDPAVTPSGCLCVTVLAAVRVFK